MADDPIYTKVTYWLDQYGKSGAPDQRNVVDFIDCETSEAKRSLQNELAAISAGRFREETMDKIIGVKRKVLHGSYEAWAKLMLQWIAGYKG